MEKAEVPPAPELDADVVEFVTANGTDSLTEAMGITGKHERKVALKAARNAVIEKLLDGETDADVIDT